MLVCTAMNGEKPPLVTKTMNILMLHDDLLLTCLARVSRLYYPTLSLVSKRFRSLLASLELYKTRTLLGCTESCLYVSLQFCQDLNSVRWFTLCRRPIQITNPNPNPNPRFTSCYAPYRALMDRTMKKKNKKSHDNVLVSIQTRNSPSLRFWEPWGLIAVGYNIYKIGGEDKNGLPSSRVFIMDCRSHTWQEAPSMRVAPKYPHVRVLDGKIYVVDSSEDIDSSDLIECFDPKTQMWEHVEGPGAKLRGSGVWKVLAIEGKLYLFRKRSLIYEPKQKKWDEIGFLETWFVWVCDCTCVIDNVLYGVLNRYGRSKKLVWYDFERRCWRALKGLRKLPNLPWGYDRVRLVGYDGKIAVFWEKDVRKEEEKKIWCAEISVERRNEHEIRGKVEWCHVVLTVPKSCFIIQFLAVTV